VCCYIRPRILGYFAEVYFNSRDNESKPVFGYKETIAILRVATGNLVLGPNVDEIAELDGKIGLITIPGDTSRIVWFPEKNPP